MAEWTCPDRWHKGDRAELDKTCGGCRMRMLVLADQRDAATAHDVRSGPCKCGAWH